MKSNKIYLSRLKRNFKDKVITPIESNTSYDSCGCKYYDGIDFKVKTFECDYHEDKRMRNEFDKHVKFWTSNDIDYDKDIKLGTTNDGEDYSECVKEWSERVKYINEYEKSFKFIDKMFSKISKLFKALF